MGRAPLSTRFQSPPKPSPSHILPWTVTRQREGHTRTHSHAQNTHHTAHTPYSHSPLTPTPTHILHHTPHTYTHRTCTPGTQPTPAHTAAPWAAAPPPGTQTQEGSALPGAQQRPRPRAPQAELQPGVCPGGPAGGGRALALPGGPGRLVGGAARTHPGSGPRDKDVREPGGRARGTAQPPVRAGSHRDPEPRPPGHGVGGREGVGPEGRACSRQRRPQATRVRGQLPLRVGPRPRPPPTTMPAPAPALLTLRLLKDTLEGGSSRLRGGRGPLEPEDRKGPPSSLSSCPGSTSPSGAAAAAASPPRLFSESVKVQARGQISGKGEDVREEDPPRTLWPGQSSLALRALPGPSLCSPVGVRGPGPWPQLQGRGHTPEAARGSEHPTLVMSASVGGPGPEASNTVCRSPRCPKHFFLSSQGQAPHSQPLSLGLLATQSLPTPPWSPASFILAGRLVCFQSHTCLELSST